MAKADIVLIIFLLLGLYQGYKEGFLMELFSLAAIILGVLGGFKLMGWAMIYLQQEFNADKATLPYIAFAVVFIVIFVVVILIGKAIRHLINKSFLGTMDSFLGALLAVFRTAFMISVILWIADSLKFNLPESWTADAWIFPIVAHLAPAVSAWVGDFIPFFREIFHGF